MARADIKMGLAVVTESACFAHQGAECGSCLAACPVGSAALFEDRTGPAVNADACTGSRAVHARVPDAPPRDPHQAAMS